jgi:hypothetical protein
LGLNGLNFFFSRYFMHSLICLVIFVVFPFFEDFKGLRMSLEGLYVLGILILHKDSSSFFLWTLEGKNHGWKSCRIVEISDWVLSPSTPRLEYSSDKPTRITPEGREGGCKKTKGVKKKIGIAAIFRWHIHWMIGSMHREDISTLKKTVLLLVSSFEFDFCFELELSSIPWNLPFLLQLPTFHAKELIPIEMELREWSVVGTIESFQWALHASKLFGNCSCHNTNLKNIFPKLMSGRNFIYFFFIWAPFSLSLEAMKGLGMSLEGLFDLYTGYLLISTKDPQTSSNKHISEFGHFCTHVL